MQIYLVIDVKGYVILDMDRGKCNEFCLEIWFDNYFEPILFNRTYTHRFCINVNRLLNFVHKKDILKVIRLIQYKIDCSKATYTIIYLTPSFLILYKRCMLVHESFAFCNFCCHFQIKLQEAWKNIVLFDIECNNLVVKYVLIDGQYRNECCFC